MKYKINEIFESIQGEGAHTGVPSIFVRLQGCPVGCPWCDTKHTWHIDSALEKSSEQVMDESQESENYFVLSVDQLLQLFEDKGYRAKHIVITGGEPCMYDLRPITHKLDEFGYSCQIETSGTYEVFAHPNTWVTVSPKIDMPGGFKVRKDAMQRANEIKHVIAMQKHIDALDNLLAQTLCGQVPLIYLQPISQQQRATELAIATCIERNWRLSLQTHKFIGIE